MKNNKKKLIQLESKVNEIRDKPIEYYKDELRDAFINFKDLQSRCVIDFKRPVSIGIKEH